MATAWICARCAVRAARGLRRSASSWNPASRSLNFHLSPLIHDIYRTGPQSPSLTSAHQIKGYSSSNNVSPTTDTITEDTSKRKANRSKTPTSLRGVAVEAQRSRSLVRGTGRRLFIDPEADTKEITAYCAAEQYNLEVVKRLLRREGYDIDPFGTGLFPQVVHVQTPTLGPISGSKEPIGAGDVFIFPSGSVVSWNVPDKIQKHLINRVLKPAASESHLGAVEVEDMEYLEDTATTTSKVVGDAIILGVQIERQSDEHGSEAPIQTEVDVTLTKVAFSSGIARSTKLAVLENLLDRYFESTKDIPNVLSRGSKLRVTRSFILRKTGELLSIRAQLNLYGELTDTMPDLFWDSPSQLGLSEYYDQVGRALDVNARIRTLNEKMDYASEIASVLRERLSEKHSTGLEWLIIFLISIEVGFGLLHLYRDYKHAKDEQSTEALLKEWLNKQLH